MCLFCRTKNPNNSTAKKTQRGEPSQPSEPVFDHYRFASLEKSERFEIVKKWSFVEERALVLPEEEFGFIRNEITRRGWGLLANPLEKFDPELVKEFYANAFPEHRKKVVPWTVHVRGVLVDYSAQSLASLIGVDTYDDDTDYYTARMNGRRMPPFKIEELEQCLCLPGREATMNKGGSRKVKILRKHLIRQAQIWMCFMLHNLLPNKHTSDVTVTAACLLFCLVQGHEVDIATLISQELRRRFKAKNMTGTLVYPALITRLCRSAGVEGIRRNKRIQRPINATYVSRECTHDVEPPHSPHPPQPPHSPHPPPPPQPHTSTSDDRLSLLLQRSEILMQRQLHYYQGVHKFLQRQSPGNDLLMTPDELQAAFPWPEDRPHPQGEAATADAARTDDTAAEDRGADATDHDGDGADAGGDPLLDMAYLIGGVDDDH